MAERPAWRKRGGPRGAAVAPPAGRPPGAFGAGGGDGGPGAPGAADAGTGTGACNRRGRADYRAARALRPARTGPCRHRTPPPPDRTPMLNLRPQVERLVESPRFQNAILALIVANGVTLGLETSPTVTGWIGPELHLFEDVVIGVFCVEIALRIFAHRLAFFRDPWGIFDLAVVGVTLVPASESLSVLRALRVLRVLRLVSAVPRLRRVVAALLRAVPGVAAVSSLLVLVFYVFAVIATNLFGSEFPDWFGTIGASMFSLFQIMTLESWSMGIVRPVMDVFPWAWAVFVSFIILSSFTVLNLFIAIIIDSMQSLHADEQDRVAEEAGEAVRREFRVHEDDYRRLLRELHDIRRRLDGRRP